MQITKLEKIQYGYILVSSFSMGFTGHPFFGLLGLLGTGLLVFSLTYKFLIHDRKDLH